ncbi:MAG: sensor histidine kinase [Spirochaetaceae bacterium]|nr:MAG: sensor histidine kinase [Spirochaetaceae bacterium]
MTTAPLPPDEEERLEKLRQYDILDSATEQDYDDIARLVTQICGTSLSTISFVDRDRQWFKASVGIEDKETSRDVAFCAHTILGNELFTVEDASADPRFADNPLVTIDPQLCFYAGMPLVTPDGYRLGALCAMDRSPRKLTAEQEEALSILARHVVDLLELRRSRRILETQNRELREVSDLKSRLMSIIAHDLRSPMATISSLMSLFETQELDDAERKELVTELHHTVSSTGYLLDNVIGWASRSLESSPYEFSLIQVDELLKELADSIRHEMENKGNRLDVQSSGGAEITCDRNVLVFVIRNLLSNANKFTANGAITLSAQVASEEAVITVADTGVGMPEHTLHTLFDWNSRSGATGTAGEKGAGLALLFCRDFLQRLGGTLTADSTLGKGTTFTVKIPVSAPEV